MSLELSMDDTTQNSEHKWKELLYTLFYEIKSEILGCKIEIEEDEYQENIKSITIPRLVDYLHDSIQILITKKIEDTKIEQRKIDQALFNTNNSKKITTQINITEKSQYENIIRKLEAKERILYKLDFQNRLQKDAMENKIGEYMEMEDEFEEMKAKFKYEDGRFLHNDRKDNEIIIIRSENSNLKKTVNKLEKQIKTFEEEIKTKENLIKSLQEQNEKLTNKLEEKSKLNETNAQPSININISNVTGNNNNNCENLCENNTKKNKINKSHNSSHVSCGNTSKYSINYANNESHIKSSSKKEIKVDKKITYNNKSNYLNNNKFFNFQKIKSKLLSNKSHRATATDLLSTTRNDSLERTKFDLLNKYFIGNKNRSISNLNNSCIKINQSNVGSNITSKKNIKYKNNTNNNCSVSRVNVSALGYNANTSRAQFNSSRSNYNSMKKIMSYARNVHVHGGNTNGGGNHNGNNNNTSRSMSTKQKGNTHGGISYRSVS